MCMSRAMQYRRTPEGAGAQGRTDFTGPLWDCRMSQALLTPRLAPCWATQGYTAQFKGAVGVRSQAVLNERKCRTGGTYEQRDSFI